MQRQRRKALGRRSLVQLQGGGLLAHQLLFDGVVLVNVAVFVEHALTNRTTALSTVVNLARNQSKDDDNFGILYSNFGS